MTELRALDDKLQELDQSSRTPSAAQLSQYLRQVRDVKVRDSEGVVRWGSLLLKRYGSTLPYEELWLVKEQVAIAAMDGPQAHAKLALQLVTSIQQQFPNSRRVERLMGMYNESRGRPKEAGEWYDKITTEQASNQSAVKRQVALTAAKGDTAAAMRLLTKYLDTYANDVEAWEELASMYLQASQYQQAAFCFEELLLHEPGRLSAHLTYAEIMYTLGGASNLRTARQYYASALQLSGVNPRALYGATATSAALAAQKGSKVADDGLGAAAAQTLIRRYREEAKEKLPLVQELLKAQGLLPTR